MFPKQTAMMRLHLFIVFWLSAASFALAQTPPRPAPAIRRVLIISIDGLRPDLALRADTPTIHELIKEGSFTFWARTTAESVTLPSHTSMLTGVVPIRHEIQWNKDLPLLHPVYPVFPTLFELAKHAGYTTAMAAGKSKFINLAKPGSLDWQFIPTESKIEDAQVTEKALAILRDHQPQVFFVHLPSVDNVGHAAGWATDKQLAAIAGADRCVGRLLAELDELKLRGSTMILVTSDHGGAGLSHGPDDPRSRHIPWIVVGPGIRKGVDLTIYAQLTVDTEDTFCTACYVLGLHPTRLPLDGKVVMEIFDRTGQELIHNQ
jgi:predicted AlkP superfamily pyrophosphatase or phosphodiesterase